MNLQELLIQGNQLTSLPESIGRLSKLKILYLSVNQLTHLPKSIGQLHRLQTLYLSVNLLSSLPDSIGQLINLQELLLQGNQLTQLPESIGQLVNLQELLLQGNQLTQLPESIGQLTQLKTFDLYENQLAYLPESIGQLINLKVLVLYVNKLVVLPESIGQLINLKILSLDGNELVCLPESIGNLVNLQMLYLSVNHLTKLPESIGQLASLKMLVLYVNKLHTLPKSIGQLRSLQILYLSANHLTHLPDSIGHLDNLEELYLYQNQLSSVPESVGHLKTLQELYLYENQLLSLPESLQSLTRLKVLYLHDNPGLGIPIEVLGASSQTVKNENGIPASPKKILDYYFRIKTQCHPLNEAKLIMVGFGAVGKTSLVNRLLYDRFDGSEKKTAGIQISQWSIKLRQTEDITLNVWDFGGQEIMHNTHQFFLTERSLYLLVLNGRKGHEDSDAEYWLELIQTFGGDSPVIVVLNKIQEHPFDLNRRGLQQKFPNLQAFVETDCAEGTGLSELRQIIEEQTDTLPHLRDAFPGSWFEIKNRLAGMAENFISFDRYRHLCSQNGEVDYEAQDQLAFYLHSLGIALNYKDDPRLRDTHVLNPHWVTTGIYTLLNAETLASHQGELTISDMAKLLDPINYPQERHYFLLELMQKFELCFRFPEGENRYLIPDLLDKQQSLEADTFDQYHCLNFQYRYPILPEGLIPRFIVRTHVLSSVEKLRWRTGVILEFEGNRALVKGDLVDKQVTISVDGPRPGRRRLLAIIRSDFEHIHRNFKFRPQERVPIPQHPEVSVSYRGLITRERKGRETIEVELEDDLLELNTQDLLNGVDLEYSRLPNSQIERSPLLPALFYSYAQQDEALKNELETHLKLLQRQQLIQTWSDRCILPGVDWQQELDERLEQAHIIVLLVSAHFLASDYCYEIEMKRALARHAAGDAIVMPIILREVNWYSTPFARLKVLPPGGKAVSSWDDRNEAWRHVEECIRWTIEQKWG